MNSITLNAFAIFILFTSCKTSQITTNIDTASKTVSMENSKWKLVTLMGADVSDTNAYISFSNETENTLFGNGSCNNFTGTYKLDEGNKISVSKLTATLMACTSMDVEKQFMAIIEMADNYTLNGNKMILNKAKMAPLAIFEAVETE